MKIAVTCPGCLTRFEVSDKFAGKKGPCPKCRKEIQVPEATEQVVIHAPETTGPKDAKGSPVLKPLRRIEANFSWPIAIGVAVSSLLLLGIAIMIRSTGNEPSLGILLPAAFLLGPALAFGGYLFLRESELQGFSGRELIVRSAICGVIYAITWGVYWLIPKYLMDLGSLEETSLIMASIMLIIMIILGSIAAVLAFELETGAAVFHYLLFLTATIILAVVSGLALAEPLAKPGSEKNTTPGSRGKRAVQVAPVQVAPAKPPAKAAK